MNYDFVLVLATVGVLFLISLLCVGGMFYFKWADLQSLAPTAEVAYQGRMNRLLAPLLVALLLVLGILRPKAVDPLAMAPCLRHPSCSCRPGGDSDLGMAERPASRPSCLRRTPGRCPFSGSSGATPELPL